MGNRERARKLLAIAEGDPDLARPGLAATRALEAFYAQDPDRIEVALADFGEALEASR